MKSPTLPDRANPDISSAAIMYSGGQDSTIILADLIKKGVQVYPICFDDGSLNFQLRRSIAIELTLQTLGVYNRMVLMQLPNLEQLRISKSGLGFIPGLKAMMMLNALSMCQVLGVNSLYIGVNFENQQQGFKDMQEEMMQRFVDLYHDMYGDEQNDDNKTGNKIKIVTPWCNTTKSEMLAHAYKNSIDLSTTISCRHVEVGAGLIHCGECQPCHQRRIAYHDAGLNRKDPTRWVVNSSCHKHLLAMKKEGFL